MDRSNILIGSGILVGLGTIAYWFLSGGIKTKTSTLKEFEALTPEQKTEFYKRAAVMQNWASPEKQKRDAYVAAQASYTPSLYE